MSSKELKYCFQNVSAERLRSLIDTICDVSDETRAIFEQELLTQEQGATSRKTKPGQPRYLKCENCEKEFDVTGNIKDSCNYHEGMLIKFLCDQGNPDTQQASWKPMMTFGSTMISMTTTRVILLNQSIIGRPIQRDSFGIAVMSNLMLLDALFRSTSTSLINNMIRWMGGRLQVKTDR